MIKIQIANFLLFLKNFFLQRIQKIKKIDTINLDNKKILIFKNGGIGDIITVYSAISNIRDKFKNAEITMISLGGKNALNSASILINQKKINTLINFDIKEFSISKKLLLLKKLRSENFGLLIIFSDQLTTFKRELRNLLFFRACKIKNIIGSSLSRPGIFNTEWASQFNHRFENEYIRNNKTIYPLSKTDTMNLSYVFNKNDYGNLNLGSRNKSITIAIGAKKLNKMWGDNNFLKLTKLLISKGYNIYFIGGTIERERTEKIINNLKKSDNLIYNFCGKTNLDESIFIIDSSKYIISNDSGAAHLSSLTNTKCITIQSACDFENLWYPIKSKDFIIRSKNNCFKEHKCKKTYFCGKDINPQKIMSMISS